MSRSAFRGIATFLCASLVGVAGVPAASKDSEPRQKLVAVHVHPAAIEFEPLVVHRGGFLAVATPDGETFRLPIAAGGRASFNLTTERRGGWPDGAYLWEVTLMSGAEPGKRARRTASGGVAVVDGVFLEPMREAEEKADRASRERISAAGSLERVVAPETVIASPPLIVGGDICAGDACQPGETFGSEEILIDDNTPFIELVDTSADPFPTFGYQIEAGEDPSTEVFQVVVDPPGNDNSVAPFKILSLDPATPAPENSLVVAPAGIGLGTAVPQGDLHISGTEVEDLFSGLGPDLVAGPAFNFGYSGNTFGPGSGFFNVRPVGTAPNPALYFATANVDRLMIDNQGFVGVHLDGVLGPGFNPAHPIHSQTSGAHLTAGGIWTDASSRDLKEEIAPLEAAAALAALARLEPVSFRYKLEPEDPHVGFISEEVPELVATPDRKTLAPMDIVAVLTKVVQEQQAMIEEQRSSLEAQRATIDSLLTAVEELRLEASSENQ